jgi:hypothetical protein
MVAPLVGAATGVVSGVLGGGSGTGGSQTGEIINLVGGVVSGLTDFLSVAIPTKLDKMRKERIRELQGRFEAGTLGLSPSQLEEIQVLGAGGIQASQKEFFQRQADLGRTGQAASSPATLVLQQQAQAEALRRQESELARATLAAERQAEKAQLGELAGLKEEQRQRNKEIGEAAKSFLSLGMLGASEGATQAEQRRQMLGTGTTITAAPEAAALNVRTPEQRAAEIKVLLPEISDEEALRMARAGL